MPESESKRALRENGTDEPSNKKVKTDESEKELREDETCQICYSERKTHAFIHAVQPSKCLLLVTWARQPEYRVRVRVRKFFLDIYSGTQVRVSHSVRYSGYSVRPAQTQELRSGSGA